jgi:DNA-binding CsgD family transcriptional regulator
MEMMPPFEMRCLRWVSLGKTNMEIALLEGKSVAEIESSLERARTLLDAESIDEAIVKANAPQSWQR